MRKKIRQGEQTQFQKLYQKGRDRKNNNESIIYFNKAKKQFDPNKDSHLILTSLIIDQARIYRKQYKFEKVKQLLQNRINTIQNDYKNLKYRDKDAKLLKLQQQFKLYSQLAQGQLAESQDIQCDNRNTDFIKKINKTYQYCIKALKTAVSGLIYEEKYQLDQQQQKQWEQYYSQAVISCIDPLLTEINKSEQPDLRIYKLIYKIADKMNKFYEISHKSQQVLKQNFRSYYYRGVTLRKTSKQYDRIEYFLTKDAQFCRNKKLHQDLEKTQTQLFTYYISCFKVQEARKLLKTEEKKKLFNELQYAKYTQLILKLQKFILSQQFKKLNAQQQRGYIEKVINIQFDDKFSWFKRFTDLGRKILINNTLRTRQLHYFVSYKTATAYFQCFDEINAFDYCQRALKNCIQGSKQHFQALFLKMQICENSNKQVQQLTQLDNKLIAIAENFQGKEQRMEKLSQVKNNIQMRKYNQKRIKFLQKQLLLTDQQKIMFEEIKQKRQKQKKDSKNRYEMFDQNSGQNENKNNKQPQISFMRQKNSGYNIPIKSNSQLLLQKYQNLCTQKQVMQRNYIIQKIKKLPKQINYIQVDLKQFFDISAKQLQIYIEICKPVQWDLRNFKPSNSLLQKIIKNCDLKQITTLKLSQIHKLIKNQTLYLLCKSCQQLNQLHLQKLDRKFIQKNSNNISKFTFDFLFPYKIKILKIKSCKLNDSILAYIVENFKQVEQLDLSNNQINGQGLHYVNQLKNIQKLNLSYNPLIIGYDKLYNRSLKKLKLKKINKFNEFSSQFAFPQMKQLKILDLSQNNSNYTNGFFKAYRDFQVDNWITEFPHFNELRLKKCNIDNSLFDLLNQLLRFWQKFQLLDLRYSYYDKIKLKKLSTYLKEVGKNINIDSRAYIDHQYKQDIYH